MLSRFIQNDFTYWKMSLKASCNQKKSFWMNFLRKDAYFVNLNDFLINCNIDWNFTTFEVKKILKTTSSTLTSYACSILSVDCRKFQKNWLENGFMKYLWQGGAFFMGHPVQLRTGRVTVGHEFLPLTVHTSAWVNHFCNIDIL